MTYTEEFESAPSPAAETKETDMADLCAYCGEQSRDPGFDRCFDCRTWRDEEWYRENVLALDSEEEAFNEQDR